MDTPKIVDGTEHRAAVLRVREGGVSKILKSLRKDGFLRAFSVRVAEHEGELLLSFDLNVGRADGYEFLSLDVDIPIKDVTPLQDEEEKEGSDEGVQVHTDPA